MHNKKDTAKAMSENKAQAELPEAEQVQGAKFLASFDEVFTFEPKNFIVRTSPENSFII